MSGADFKRDQLCKRMDQGQEVTVIDVPYFGKLKWGIQVSIQVRKKAAGQRKRIVLFQRLLKIE